MRRRKDLLVNLSKWSQMAFLKFFPRVPDDFLPHLDLTSVTIESLMDLRSSTVI